MNILFLSPWLPWPPFDGARIRIFETLRYLAQRHRITLLTSVRHPEDIEQATPLQGLCEKVITTLSPVHTWAVLRRLAVGSLHRMPLIESFHYDRNLALILQGLTARNVYDVIHVEFPFLVSYLASVHPSSRAKKVLSMHNIESIRFERELHYLARNARRLLIQWDRFFFKSWEQEATRQFDGITVVSDLDEDWIQRHAPGVPIALVPNGVDTQYFFPVDASANGPSLVFTGLMNYPSNVDAAVWFCDAILPKLRRQVPTLRFNIVGSRPHPSILALGQRQGVHVTGEVADVRPYLAECLAMVVPLRSGGGTRLKILQAMAMARPVISTSLGAEGLEVTPGGNILIADDPAEFAHHILCLMTSPEAATRLGKGGRQLVASKYDWRICLRAIENLYDKLVAGEGSHRPNDLSKRERIPQA